VAIADVKTNGLAVPLLKLSDVIVVNEYKPLNLCLVEHLEGIKEESTHIGDKAYEETIPSKQGVMVSAHQHAVSWVTRIVFSLGGDPPKGLKVCPLCVAFQYWVESDVSVFKLDLRILLQVLEQHCYSQGMITTT
jgi:hypothetical protein